MRRRRRFTMPPGMTVTELVMVAGVMTILSGMLFATYRYQAETYRQQTSQVITQDDLRVWVTQIVRDLRRAGYDPTGSGNFRFTVHDSSDVRFTFDSDADGTVDAGESLGYRLQDGTLERWHGGASYRPLLTGVADLAFTYRDAQGAVVTSAAPSIRTVEIALSAEAPESPWTESMTEHVPSIVVGAERTTISASSEGTRAAAVYAYIDRATIRNPN